MKVQRLDAARGTALLLKWHKTHYGFSIFLPLKEKT